MFRWICTILRSHDSRESMKSAIHWFAFPFYVPPRSMTIHPTQARPRIHNKVNLLYALQGSMPETLGTPSSFQRSALVVKIAFPHLKVLKTPGTFICAMSQMVPQWFNTRKVPKSSCTLCLLWFLSAWWAFVSSHVWGVYLSHVTRFTYVVWIYQYIGTS